MKQKAEEIKFYSLEEKLTDRDSHNVNNQWKEINIILSDVFSA